MTGLFLAALLLPGASGLYLCVVIWSVRASKRRVFTLPWLLLPLGGALLAGVALALGVPSSSASPVSLRLLELLAHLCAILLIWTIAGNIAPAYRLTGTWLYAWNPLVLIELAIYANTAGVVTCLLLLAVALLTRSVPAFRRGGGDKKARRRPQGSPLNLSSTPASTKNEPGEPHRSHSRGGGEVEEGRGPLRSPSDQQIAGNKAQLTFLLSEFAALALVGLALRINFLTLLLAPLLLWFMVRHRRSVSAALMGFVWRALLVLAVFALAYLPDWRGSETFLAITNGLSLFDFANSPLSLVVAPARSLFTFVAQRANFPPLMQPDIAADMAVLATSFFLFALLYLREMGSVRTGSNNDALREVVQRDAGTERVIMGEEVLFTGWTVVIVGYIVLAATVFLPGYIVWSVWVVALRRFDTLSVCVLLLSCSALLYYPLQWFALASTGFLVPLCVFGVPLVYLVVYYCLPVGRMEGKKVLK